jgi:hypothetical protein
MVWQTKTNRQTVEEQDTRHLTEAKKANNPPTYQISLDIKVKIRTIQTKHRFGTDQLILRQNIRTNL